MVVGCKSIHLTFFFFGHLLGCLPLSPSLSLSLSLVLTICFLLLRLPCSFLFHLPISYPPLHSPRPTYHFSLPFPSIPPLPLVHAPLHTLFDALDNLPFITPLNSNPALILVHLRLPLRFFSIFSYSLWSNLARAILLCRIL